MSNSPVFLYNKEAECILNVISCAASAGHTSDGHPVPAGYEVMDASKSEGAAEKHTPVVEVNGCQITVKVGSIYHPMTEEHSIGWVCLHTQNCCQFVTLCPDKEPVAKFAHVEGDTPITAYAYCNLHGLWKCDL